ncbi:MAG: cyclase family protein [Candidatus Omnitrophica bacterium]|nr:cyclase family protein [Candidatus Omnitrophota bacterium]
MKYIDVTKSICVGMDKYYSDPEIKIDEFKSLEKGNSCNLVRISFGSHTGTHIDAPRHIFDGKKPVNEIAIKELICNSVVTEVSNLEQKDFWPEIIEKKVKAVLLKGIEDKYALREKQAELLIKNNINLVGTERMSIEGSLDKSHPVHRMLLSRNIYIIEGLDLKNAEEGFYKLICLPLKIKDGDGAPVRAVLAYD